MQGVRTLQFMPAHVREKDRGVVQTLPQLQVGEGDTMTSIVERLALAHGFKLKRQKNHRVLGDAVGRTLVIPNTPSDTRWEANALGTPVAHADLNPGISSAGKSDGRNAR